MVIDINDPRLAAIRSLADDAMLMIDVKRVYGQSVVFTLSVVCGETTVPLNTNSPEYTMWEGDRLRVSNLVRIDLEYPE